MPVQAEAVPAEVVQLRSLVKRIERRLNPDRPPLAQRQQEIEADASLDRIGEFRAILRETNAVRRQESSTGAQEWVLPDQDLYVSITARGEFIIQRNATLLTRGIEAQRLRDWLR